MSAMVQRADDGCDAPYALLTFAALGAASLVSWWNQRGGKFLVVSAVNLVQSSGCSAPWRSR